jgi:hypothetical protein
MHRVSGQQREPLRVVLLRLLRGELGGGPRDVVVHRGAREARGGGVAVADRRHGREAHHGRLVRQLGHGEVEVQQHVEPQREHALARAAHPPVLLLVEGVVRVGAPREVGGALGEVIKEDVDHLEDLARQPVEHPAKVRRHRVRGRAEAARRHAQPQPAAARAPGRGGGDERGAVRGGLQAGARGERGRRLEQGGEGLGGDAKELVRDGAEVGVVVEGVVEGGEEAQVVVVQLRGVRHRDRLEGEQRVHLVIVPRDHELALRLRLGEARDHRRELQPHAVVVRAALERRQQRGAPARVVLGLPAVDEDAVRQLRVAGRAAEVGLGVRREQPLRQRGRPLLDLRRIAAHPGRRQLCDRAVVVQVDPLHLRFEGRRISRRLLRIGLRPGHRAARDHLPHPIEQTRQILRTRVPQPHRAGPCLDGRHLAKNI